MRRNLIGGSVALLATLTILGVHQLLFTPPPASSREYAVTGLVSGNYGWIVAVLLFVVGVAVAYIFRSSPLATGAGLILILAAATCYEVKKYPTSHNLLPFDIISWFVMAAPLMLGSILGNRLRPKQAPQRLS